MYKRFIEFIFAETNESVVRNQNSPFRKDASESCWCCLLSLAAASRYVVYAPVSGNSSAGVVFVVALLHSETRPFLDQVSPKSRRGLIRLGGLRRFPLEGLPRVTLKKRLSVSVLET